MREEMEQNWDWRADDKEDAALRFASANRNANGYFKIGMPVGPSVYDPDEQDECVRTWRSSPTSTTSTRTPISG